MRRPEPNESAPYYSGYINLVSSDNILETLENQLTETETFLSAITDEQSRLSYAPGKWTIGQVLNHVNDTERVFLYRAFWFARCFQAPLPGYDQDLCVEAAEATRIPWSEQVAEFRHVRLSSLSFFKNLPATAWSRTGIASDNPFTVRSLAYIIAGHVTHHTGVIRDRYLV